MSARPVTITYLEMEHPAMLRAKYSTRAGVTFERSTPPDPAVAARFYAGIGKDYHWTDRLTWTDQQWRDWFETPGTEMWVLKVNGQEAGFCILREPAPRTRDIKYLGLLPGFAGHGLGAHVLTAAVERAWESGADRVTVNTCSLDHPSALPNYVARGFEIVHTHTEVRELSE